MPREGAATSGNQESLSEFPNMFILHGPGANERDKHLKRRRLWRHRKECSGNVYHTGTAVDGAQVPEVTNTLTTLDGRWRGFI